MLKLVIQDDEGKTWVVPLIRDELTIGRKEGNTIRLTERNVSRSHAKVLRVNGAITIEDLDSYNGIRVNGSRIDGKAEIKEADRVQIGDYLIEIKSEAVRTDSPTGEVAAASVPESVGADSGAATVPVTAMNGAEPTEVDQPTAQEPPPAAAAAAAAAESTGHDEEADTEVTTVLGIRPVARFVMLSTEEAGREFELAEGTMVIGRTDDNDFSIDHRSISRHHAKVIYETGHFTISDLDSSNGVRVNGEDYTKTALRRGDLVDLGHVRLRFVEAGEDFVFGRDAHAVDLSKEEPRLWMWLLFLGLAMGAVVAVIAVVNGNVDTQQAARIIDAAVAKVEPVADAPVAPTPVTDPHTELLVKIDEAAVEENWDEMASVAERLLAEEPDNTTAKAAKERAQQENQNKKTYDEFVDAVANSRINKVAELYRQLGEDSIYRAKAEAEHEQTKQLYIAQVRRAAKRAAERGDCRGQKRLATSAVWSDAAKAILSYRCKTVRPSKPEKDPDVKKPEPDPEPDKPDYQASLTEAREAAKSNHFGKALRLCRDALTARPGDQAATLVCAMAACNLQREGDARRYHGRLRAEQQAHVVQICLRNGVGL